MKIQKKKKESNELVLDAISNLAQTVGAGFDKTDMRFDRVDKRLEDLQYQITRIETYILQDHERRLEHLEHKIGKK